jgi:hypothetical protein
MKNTDEKQVNCEKCGTLVTVCCNGSTLYEGICTGCDNPIEYDVIDDWIETEVNGININKN